MSVRRWRGLPRDEHVLPGVYQLLDAVLGDDSQCRVLATSREPVGLDGEVLWTRAPLALKGDAAGAEDEPAAASSPRVVCAARPWPRSTSRSPPS